MIRYTLLVQWGDGETLAYPIPEAIGLHIGGGEAQAPVPMHAPGGSYLGALIVHGDRHPTWTIAEHTIWRDEAVERLCYYEDHVAALSASRGVLEGTPPPAPELARIPDELVSILSTTGSEEISENDVRRVHALADLVTSLDLLQDALNHMGESLSWTQEQRMRRLVDRARNHLQTILSNAEFLTETTPDRIDLSLPGRAWRIDPRRQQDE